MYEKMITVLAKRKSSKKEIEHNESALVQWNKVERTV